MNIMEQKESDGGFFWGIPAFLWQLLFFYVPLAFLISTSFVKYVPELGTTAFTFDHYKSLLKPVYYCAIARSLLLATVTALVCFIIAYPVAYYLALKVKRCKTI